MKATRRTERTHGQGFAIHANVGDEQHCRIIFIIGKQHVCFRVRKFEGVHRIRTSQRRLRRYEGEPKCRHTLRREFPNSVHILHHESEPEAFTSTHSWWHYLQEEHLGYCSRFVFLFTSRWLKNAKVNIAIKCVSDGNK